MVDGGQGPCHAGDAVGERQRFGGSAQVSQRGTLSSRCAGREPGDAQHDGCRVDADHRGGTGSAGAPDSDAGAAPDVDDVVAVADAGQLHGELGVGVAAEVEAQRGDEATDTAEARVVGVVVGWKCGIGLGDRHVEHLDT